MPRITFDRDYNHRWPSRAVTAFKKGWTGSVKAEVAETAIPKYATAAPKRANVRADGRLPDSGRGRELARPDDAHRVGASVRNQVLDGAGQ